MSKDIYPFQKINKEELLTMIYDVLKSPVFSHKCTQKKINNLKHSCIK